MERTLRLSMANSVAEIAFHRPEHMNTLDNVMADELLALTERIRHDSSIRAVVLKGNGPLFMAGGDIQFFKNNLETMPAGVKKIVHAVNGSILNLMRMPKPVLASVHGSVAGVGMSFMMACDLVIAAESTRFTMAYSGIGITPDGGASFLLPRLVGTKKAMQWVLLPDLFDAAEAKQTGLVNWIVPDDTLADETHRLATRLANGPTRSYAMSKRLLNESLQSSLETQLEREAEAFEACSATMDFKAGVTGFLKKSRPVFEGK